MNYDILEGDALSILPSLTENSFDAVITDPPYSSGGATLSAKIQATSKKYTNTKSACPFPDFEGDAKDQRSWTRWCAEWLMLARKASKPGAPVCVFCDWRQQPSLTDALQWAGWIWIKSIPDRKKAVSANKRNSFYGVVTGTCPSRAMRP